MPKIISVQYLRGAAALTVIVAHAFEYPVMHPSFDSLIIGRLGVVLFFVISGFIMVVTTGMNSFNANTFLKRRIERIVPLYWLVTLLTFALAIFAGSMFKTTKVSVETLIQSLLFIPHMNLNGKTIEPIMKLGWTLNYEAFFYVVFATIFFTRVRLRVSLITIILSIIVLTGKIAHPHSIIMQFYCNPILLSFCAGSWLGLLWLEGIFARTHLATRWLLFLGIAGTTIAMFAMNREGSAFTNGRLAEMIIFSACSICLGLSLEAEGKLIKSAVIEKFGDASYSLYLAHMFGLALIISVTRKVGLPYTAMVLTGGIAGILIGFLSYTLIERPITNLFRYK